MIFSTWLFGLFFSIVFAAYWATPSLRARHLLLLLASYVFYMTWNPWLALLIFGSTATDYVVAIGMSRCHSPRSRRQLLVASVAINLGVLALFKYADFFILSAKSLLEALGLQPNLSTLSLILPVGISFYTFQTLSYTIDVYRGRIEPERSFVNFALFVAFFPQLVAGPIVKASEFLPQLQSIKRFDWSRLDAAALLFLVGLSKKVLLADNFAGVADSVFADPARFKTADLWLAMFCYGGQIYCDFSGYSDMAIATAMALGFDLPVNFATPYLATSLSDFWRRWHISLSTWLRDYLYIPLGGSRGGRLFTVRNLMITMLLGGLWHGASWTFVIWGAIHGAVLSAARFWPKTSPTRPLQAGQRLRTAAGWLATLLVVHLAWVFFRCQPIVPEGAVSPEPTSAALARALTFVSHLFIPATIDNPAWLMNKWPMVALLILLALLHVWEDRQRRRRSPYITPALSPDPSETPRIGPARSHLLPAPLAGVGYAVWILAIVLFSADNDSPFIYFQF